MSYLFPKGPNARYKIYKVSVSTPEDKVLQNTSDFNYEVELPYAITDVVGMSLVEWSFPRDVIPSFYPTTTNLVGNIYLDFRLEKPGYRRSSWRFHRVLPYEILGLPATR